MSSKEIPSKVKWIGILIVAVIVTGFVVIVVSLEECDGNHVGTAHGSRGLLAHHRSTG